MIQPTAEQQAIISYPLQPLRVAAGAGTGKTTTMALRLAALVRDHGIAPEAALGVTFTNKAAGELADRIRAELADLAAEGRTVEVTTYHGFAYGLLREWGAVVGVERRAPLVTPGYARQLLRDALGAGGYDTLDVTHPPSRVDELATLASQLGDHLARPGALAAAVPAPGERSAAWEKRAELAVVLDSYQQLKADLGAVDYADLIRLAHELMSRHPDIGAIVRHRYRVVLLDEYQDTNPGQRELLRAVFGDGFPVTAVGDADQTIYEWRGASLENFAGFPAHFASAAGPAETLVLSQNRRSDQAILDLANQVRDRIGGEKAIAGLRPGPGARAGRVSCGWFRTATEEAHHVASEIRAIHDNDGVAWRDIGVLFRKNQHIGLIRDALELQEVPVEVASLGGLLGVPEVNDLHAWLKVLGRPDDAAALVRILVRSRFRLGLRDLAPLAGWVRARHHDGTDDDAPVRWALLEAVEHLDECRGLRAEAEVRLTEFLALYRGLLQEAQGVSLVELCRRILDGTGAWPEVEAMEDAGRLSARLNLYRFLDLAEEWSPLEGRPSLDAFLDYLDLLQEDRATDELDTARLGGEDAVALLTVHRAKGLEWPAVFLPALAEGIFPASARRYDDPEKHAQLLPFELRLDGDRLAEMPAAGRERAAALRRSHDDQEWRTAYVGVTRAQHLLHATGAYWYTEKRPKQRGDLYDLIASMPGVDVVADVDDPGSPPETLRVELLVEGAPDPHFSQGGWQQELRLAIEDPGRPEARATDRGAADAYHAQVEQLRMTLDGLPAPLELDGDDGSLRTSVTGLVTYATCPQRYRWTEVDRLPRKPSAAARRGVEVHRRIELHNRGAVPLDEVDADFYDAPAGGAGTPVATAHETFLGSRFADTKPRFVEVPFDLQVSDARVRGRIDAIYEPEPGWWEVVDFKSGEPSAQDARRVQLEAYALAATDVPFAPEPPERLSVTFAYLGGGLTVESEDVDAGWLADARTHVAELVAGAAAGRFVATPSPSCRNCDFLQFCAEGQAWMAEQ